MQGIRSAAARGVLAAACTLAFAFGVAEPAGAQQSGAARRDTSARAQQPAAAAAQAGDSTSAAALLKTLTWRNVGPNRGGRSIAVGGSAARPLEYWFGATGGGAWKTTDGGQTWKPMTDGKIGSSSVGALAVCESNPDVVYVGMGETELRGNVMQGDGVYRTGDGGKTWQHVGLEATQTIGKIVVAPGGCDDVYVAAFGHPYGKSPERGIFRTTDGGKSWQKILYRDDHTGGIDIVQDATDPKVLYAALWDAFRTPWTLSSGGPGSGIFKTIDGGVHWTELTRNPGLPKDVIGKVGLAVSPVDAKRVWAQVEARDGGLYRSDDAGATWAKVNEDRKLRQRAFYYSRIYADPKDRDVVYGLNVGFYRSKDGGKTFPQSIRPQHGDNHTMWIAPNDPKRMIESNDGGANVSVNGGESWTSEAYPTAQLYHIIADAHRPYFVCGAQQDNSTACMPSKDWRFLSSSGGAAGYFFSVGGGESGYIANSPADPDVYFAGSYGGLLTAFNRSTGQQRAINPWPDNPMGYSASDIAERFQWTFPIVVDPLDPKTLYAGSQHLWRSTNEGQSWERISPDLTRHDPKTLGPSGGPITLDQTGVETYGTIFSIAPSPVQAGVIWTGSDDGYVQLSRDGGKTWANVTPKELPPFARISMVEASPVRVGTAYVAANRYQMDDFGVYAYRTDDFGKTWTRITNGIKPNDYVRVVRQDPKRPELLYAGTEHGFYVSFDDGASWQPFSLNLPDTQVPDLVVQGGDVVVATHGRSAYILDGGADLLRQLSPQVVAADVHLFRPSPAVRSVDQGATIYYRLKKPATKLSLDILDASGRVVRSFAPAKPKPDSAKRGEGEEEDEDFGPRAQTTIRDSAGLNKFTWDMRYAEPASFPKMILWAARPAGPRALPGTYQVRLTADGVVQTQPLEVQMDPRLKNVTLADLQAQFDLASKINDRFGAANAAVAGIRALRDSVQAREKQTPDAGVHKVADALVARVTAIEEKLYQTRLQASEDPLNYPIMLNNKLAALQGTVESSDARPTEQSNTVFQQLSAALQVQLDALRQVYASDLTALNVALQAKGLPPVSAPRTLAAGEED